jgi:diaminopimelate epimerase
MGRPSFEPEAVPVAAAEPIVEESISGIEVTALTTGVPHAVHFVDDVDDVALDDVAEPIRNADIFPEGANVTLAARQDADSAAVPQFAQRTYERGVEGETRACGTGAVAILAAARRLGRVTAETAVIHPPGGELRVTVPENGPATLRGPVEVTASGTLSPDPDRLDEATIEVGDHE